MADNKRRYRVLVGLNWAPNKRAEPGEIRDDIPVPSLGWLLRDGLIEPVEDEPQAAPEEAKGGEPE